MPVPPSSTPLPPSRPAVALAIAVGCLLSLVLSGYQLGQSNHTVYLLDALRQSDPALLANDWFTTQTLQYHGLFSLITRGSLALGIMPAVFLIGYLLTVVLFHVFVWQVVRAIGGEHTRPVTYLLAIVLFHFAAGGTGLGAFHFLQDGAFLPSNVANVALLGVIASLMRSRIWQAAIWTGIAGIFHVNHAAVAPFVFAAGVFAQPGFFASPGQSFRRALPPALLAALLVCVNLIPALLHLRSQAPSGQPMPLAEFVELYARLRHPHHYYPPGWPALLYLACLWPVGTGAWVLLQVGWRIDPAPRRVLVAVWCLLLTATLGALLFAGVVFLSERLIQMALFRFTIHLMLLGAAVTAWGIVQGNALGRRGPTYLAASITAVALAGLIVTTTGLAGTFAQTFVLTRPAPILLTAGLSILIAWLAASPPRLFPPSPLACSAGIAAVMLTCALGWNRGFGLNFIPADPPAYLRLAEWARDNTPKDAIFLVPPGEQAWRLAARRAVVINLKAIPQTSAELPEWKRRMQAVTGQADLMTFAGDFSSTLQKLDTTYAARPPNDLLTTARQFNATYLVTPQILSHPHLQPVGPPELETAPYLLYRIDTATP